MSDNPKCKCNYQHGMGPNLLCPEHGKREDLGGKIERQFTELEGLRDGQDAFNAAINFAVDDADGDGIIFLQMWREGDWKGIIEAFPEFKSPILHPKA
jgi:hypothetical protein